MAGTGNPYETPPESRYTTAVSQWRRRAKPRAITRNTTTPAMPVSSWGVGQRHTLAELLNTLHKARESGWAPSYIRNQKRMRAFWIEALGQDCPLPLPAGIVEDAARDAARAKGWTPRTHQAYLRYIVDAAYYGQRKLKWYGEQDNLSSVDFPAVQTISRPYSKDEIRRLLACAEAVDLRLAAWLHIAYDGARRSTAIRTLPASAYRVEGDRGTIHFPGHTDKARRSGVVVLSQSGREVVERLIATPAVKSSGLLFPGEWRGPRRACMTDRTLRRKLRALEQAAGVDSIPGRAMHGVKRRATTDAIRLSGVRTAAKQSGTSEATLQRHYDQDDMDDKAELADRLEALKRAPKEDT
jgi:hypothetical protein